MNVKVVDCTLTEDQVPAILALYPMDDPYGLGKPLWTTVITGEGILKVPGKAELGQAAWGRALYADGTWDHSWPEGASRPL